MIPWESGWIRYQNNPRYPKSPRIHGSSSLTHSDMNDMKTKPASAAWNPGDRQVWHIAFRQSSMQVPKVVLFWSLHAANRPRLAQRAPLRAGKTQLAAEAKIPDWSGAPPTPNLGEWKWTAKAKWHFSKDPEEWIHKCDTSDLSYEGLSIPTCFALEGKRALLFLRVAAHGSAPHRAETARSGKFRATGDLRVGPRWQIKWSLSILFHSKGWYCAGVQSNLRDRDPCRRSVQLCPTLLDAIICPLPDCGTTAVYEMHSVIHFTCYASCWLGK